MKIKAIIDEDLTNYKKPSMFICFPTCTFKCESDCGLEVCQNRELINSPSIHISYYDIVARYMSNNLTEAFVFGGLEPFDGVPRLLNLIEEIRKNTNDDIVIYSGYELNEISEELEMLSQYKNIIVKLGRYIPNQEKHYDENLGVYLASNNQYAIKL